MVSDLDWGEIAPHPASILASGGIGEGKTALMGTYYDYARSKKLELFSIGRSFPKIKKKGINFNPPKNSMTGLDDAHLLGVYAHAPGKNVQAWDFVQRQKRHGKRSVFWTTQDTTGFTVRLIRMLSCICLFNPDMMLLEYERPVMMKKYQEATKALEPYRGKKGYVWIQWQDENKTVHKEVYKFELPKWWTEDISEGEIKGETNLFSAGVNTIKSIGRLFG